MSSPYSMLSLERALRLTGSPACSPAGTPALGLALVGAGGKTSALAALCEALQPCIAAATTHMGDWQVAFAHRHVVWEPRDTALPRGVALTDDVTLVTGPAETAIRRLRGLSLDQAAVLLDWTRTHDRPLIIEADGSRQRPLKAPASHEPPIPASVDVVVIVAGLTGIGHPLDDAHVHRPERFTSLSGCAPGESITADHVARVLRHADGGQKNIPAAARRVVLLNQADSPELQALGADVARLLMTHVDTILVAGLRAPHSGAIVPDLIARPVFAAYERVAGTILAAGSSSRLGRPKQLLDFKGRPFVRAVAEAALASGLTPVQVVTGDHADAMAEALKDLPVTLVHNPAWREGQAASIRAGVAALPANTGATVFLLADQPHVPPALIRALTEAHALGLFPVVAPVVGDRRGNPVLFDRVTFPDLLALTGDVGGRAAMARIQMAPGGHEAVRLVPWPDDRILLDVDTPEDFRRLTDRF
jgi:molybdenum cofactor cytidylyltransferase